jgi:hypothetical protein
MIVPTTTSSGKCAPKVMRVTAIAARYVNAGMRRSGAIAAAAVTSAVVTIR